MDYDALSERRSGDRHQGNRGEFVVHAGGTRAAAFTDNVALVAACRAGDHSAWAQIIERYERLVYAIPMREGLRRDDAADVTQETFTVLVNNLHQIRDPDRLGYWLMTVARRLTWRLRNGLPDAVLDLNDVEDDAAPGSDDETLQALWVYEAIMNLEDPCRTLVIALFFDPAEPSYGEIAVRLGRPLGSVGPLRARCLERLRAILGAA